MPSTVVAGRRVFHVVGRLTQTVNVCTEAGARGSTPSVTRCRSPCLSTLWISPVFRTWRRSASGCFCRVVSRWAQRPRRQGGRRYCPPRRASLRSSRPTLRMPPGLSVVKARSSPLFTRSSWSSLRRRTSTVWSTRSTRSCGLRLEPDCPTRRACGSAQASSRSWCTRSGQKPGRGLPRTGPRPRGASSTLRCCLRSRLRPPRSPTSWTAGSRPPLVIEVGLDYDARHLQGDIWKLTNSDVPLPYLLHLSRVSLKDDARHEIERLVLHPGGRLRCAYAHLDPRTGAVQWKHLDEDSITFR